MLSRRVSGLLVSVVVLGLWLPVTASPGFADDTGATVTIAGPDQFAAGEQAVITVDAHTAAPVGPDDFVSLDVILPPRLVADSVQATGFACSVFDSDPGQDVECFGSGFTDSGSVQVTVTAGPGSEEFETIQAQFQTSAESVESDKTAGPGSTESAFAQAVLSTPGSQESADASIIVFGDNLTTVSGRVWNDLNRDGRQDPTEPGIAGISVSSQFSTTTTDENGRYELTDLERGDTEIFFVAPGRFDFTRPNVGDDLRDSDVTSTERDCQDCVGGTVLLTVTGPTEHVDAGLFDPAVPVRTHGLTMG